MSARDVLRYQADLTDRLANPVGPLGRFVGHYAKHQYGDERAGTALSTTMHNHLLGARAYYVADNMVDLAVRRAEDPDYLTGTELVSQFEPPFALGFCVFGKSLDMIEMHGRTQRSLALTWGPSQVYATPEARTDRMVSGRLVALWNNASVTPDEQLIFSRQQEPKIMESLRLTGGWQLSVLEFLPYDRRIGPIRVEVPYEQRQLAIIQEDTWVPATPNHTRILCALWELMGETIAAGTPVERPDRQTAKVAKRAKIGTEITVIKLRSESRPVLNPGSGSPLTHRVPVNGHYRTLHRGTEQERTVWVRDHERGPRDAPYRQTSKVYSLVR